MLTSIIRNVLGAEQREQDKRSDGEQGQDRGQPSLNPSAGEQGRLGRRERHPEWVILPGLPNSLAY